MVDLKYKIAIKQSDGTVKYYRAKRKNASNAISGLTPYIKTDIVVAQTDVHKPDSKARTK